MALRRECCGTDVEGNHELHCPMILLMNERFKRDFTGETFRDSYINHSASAVRKRALAAGNGKSFSSPFDRRIH